MSGPDGKFWVNTELHKDEEQLIRQAKAQTPKCNPFSLSKEEQTALFEGSNNAIYETTLDYCSCKDFAFRKLPCKHMYRLAHELGLFNLDNIKIKGWGGWPIILHKENAQKERLYRGAYEEMLLVNNPEDDKSMKINGYQVSLNSCTCADFKERRKPCKHIYRMAIMEGLAKIPSESTGSNYKVFGEEAGSDSPKTEKTEN